MELKVIGAGLGRTGTVSLKAALEKLGYTKCYNFPELITHPESISQWENLSQGTQVNWEQLFGGYQSIVDYPGCYFYKEIFEKYKNAKVILTLRDPDKWYTSTLKTIYNPRLPPKQLISLFLKVPFSKKIRTIPRVIRFYDQLIWKGMFGGRFEEKDHALAVYKQHTKEVQHVVPPEQLLVYRVEEGWKPLCEFLNKPIPSDEPFPHLNIGKDFKDMQREIYANLT